MLFQEFLNDIILDLTSPSQKIEDPDTKICAPASLHFFIDEEFIINNCPKIIKGIKKLIDWVKHQK